MQFDVLKRDMLVIDGMAVITSTIKETLSLQELEQNRRKVQEQIFELESQINSLESQRKGLLQNKTDIENYIKKMLGGGEDGR